MGYRTWGVAAGLGVVLAVAVGIVLRTFVVGAVHVASRSMEETLLPGDFVLVNRLVAPQRVLLQIPFVLSSPRSVRIPPIRRIRLGDVLVVHPPAGAIQRRLSGNAFLLKRCVGTPGDTLAFRGSTLTVNGGVVTFPLAARQSRAPVMFTAPEAPVTLIVPPDAYFLIGDNPADSEDSRMWGPVPYASIAGSAAMVYWSVRPPSQRTGPGADMSSVRWDRLGNLIR